MKINKYLLYLVILAALILFAIGLYEIFFKPPEIQVNTQVDEISTYFGEDVLEAISK